MLHKKRKLLKNQKGFTLIELLAVIVILAIIAAIAIPAINTIIKHSKISAIKSDAVQVINAAKLYVSSNSVPDEGIIQKTDIDKYLDDEVNLSSYTVTVSESDGKMVYKLNGTGEDDGVTVTFKDATIGGINDKSTKYDTTVNK
ncbi:prepilin-type N-terminal cleavage/methylation domain-containing protein [Heyndrickxia coagulans]|uniref:Prepilin-type N-terminal cleavage/methylation domain-containing protein n=1 Tax=Heyndrickxia coagulans TaxID=1398 RepID=A0AAW7CG04_HEYCO|nr:prepilin-type N-terminal cleavage/methylation domain-containing protein [Heyndrickxia coagulans]AEH53926.1 Tfp pilus assembly protein major pilin [Heyndrickxia coagulans 2-6]MDL5041189.1 prepilin-type N-terminal cleavage/methylation domain-containing protein [Heyndrickxia coagulans]